MRVGKSVAIKIAIKIVIKATILFIHRESLLFHRHHHINKNN